MGARRQGAGESAPGARTPATPASVHTLTLIGGSASCSSARDFVRSQLAAVPWPGDVEAAVLLASELVANAARHAGGACRLTLHVNGRMLRVEAADRSRRPAELRVPDELDDAGRGLLLVDVLSSDWGVESRAGLGKVVWFELRA